MRATLAVMLLLPVAVAGEDFENRIRELLPLLGSNDPADRRVAARRLVALGNESIPALKKFTSNDPEVRRALRTLARRNKVLRLHATAPSGPQRIGMPVRLTAELANSTDDSYLISLTNRAVNGHGTKSAFQIRIAGRKPQWLRPDQVEIIHPQDRVTLLEPDATMRVAIRLNGADSPLRRPGMIRFTIVYDGTVALAIAHGGKGAVTALNQMKVVLKAPELTIEARGRKPAELDLALRSDNKDVVQSALAEVLLREDAEVLTLLRKSIGNPLLRARAIERIGAAKKPEDLDLIRKIAGSKREPIKNRMVAILALGNYQHRKARSRLFMLAQEARLRNAAVAALTRHKTAPTIDCFVRLLQRSYREGQWSVDALAAILKWTDKHVENRKGEIMAFERWWRENREAWITSNR